LPEFSKVNRVKVNPKRPAEIQVSQIEDEMGKPSIQKMLVYSKKYSALGTVLSRRYVNAAKISMGPLRLADTTLLPDHISSLPNKNARHNLPASPRTRQRKDITSLRQTRIRQNIRKVPAIPGTLHANTVRTPTQNDKRTKPREVLFAPTRSRKNQQLQNTKPPPAPADISDAAFLALTAKQHAVIKLTNHGTVFSPVISSNPKHLKTIHSKRTVVPLLEKLINLLKAWLYRVSGN
jgi:hypothetical protein